MRRVNGGFSALVAFAVLRACAMAQDTRHVVEPVFPAICSIIRAQLAIVAGEPSSETAFDTTRIQAAMDACPAGQAVELAGSGADFGFLTAPLNIPSGVTLLVDGGVTLFASRNPADFQSAPPSATVDTCGTVGPHGNGCKPLFTVNGGNTSTGSGIMGYGVVNGRGNDTLIVNGTPTATTWWNIADAYTTGTAQNNFLMFQAGKANSFTFYKITFINAPEFHVAWKGIGLTVWGMKIITPFSAHNSDGIDPDGTNITIANSSISDGDDDVAVGASSPSLDVTISDVTTYSGHGISVGSYTQGGLTNMLVDHVNMAGTANDGNATGIRLKSAMDRGGLIQNVTYQNMCIKDIRHELQYNPFYNTNPGTLIPQFKNITMRNIHFLTEGLVQIQGVDANHTTTLTMDNVVFEGLKPTDVTPATQYTAFTLGPGAVYPAFMQSLTGPGVSYTGTAPALNTAASPCTGVFPYVVGEIYVTGGPTAATVQLNAMVEPAMSQVSYKGYIGAAALTEPITFLEGGNVVGNAPLGANGTLATLNLTGVTPGVHTYTAQYPGDTIYGVVTLGTVTTTVAVVANAPTVTALSATPTAGTYGSVTALTATVSATTGTPSGQVNFLDGTTVIGSSALAGTPAVASLTTTLGGGAHSLTAVYTGDTGFQASTSTASTVTLTSAASTTILTAAPSSITIGMFTTLTATVGGVTGGSAPAGTVTFLEGSTTVGAGSLNGAGKASNVIVPATVGTHTYTATYAGNANYAGSSAASATVTVTGAATSTTLIGVPASVLAGAVVTVSATVASAAGIPTGTVSFLNGSTALGTASLSGGIATFNLPTTTPGTQTITAVYAANGNFNGSTSSAATIVIAPPIVLLAAPSSVSIKPGGSATIALTVTPSAGASGTVAYTCTTSAPYVTCALAAGSQLISATTPLSSIATLGVASTYTTSNVVSANQRGWYAIALPLGLLGLAGLRRDRSRTRMKFGASMVILLASVALSLAGCANSVPLPPAGAQTVTITATNASFAQTTLVTVNVTN